MKTPNKDPKQTELAKGFTVADYEVARDEKNRDRIACAVRARFMERYITPVTSAHGFTIMAISCLMIETLESFRQGWKCSPNTERAFKQFFGTNNRFAAFLAHSRDFAKHVRCGILHQAETTGGWRITRESGSPLLASKTINADCFLNNLREVLDEFCDDLKKADWDSAEWKNIVAKMNAICKNCE